MPPNLTLGRTFFRGSAIVAIYVDCARQHSDDPNAYCICYRGASPDGKAPVYIVPKGEDTLEVMAWAKEHLVEVSAAESTFYVAEDLLVRVTLTRDEQADEDDRDTLRLEFLGGFTAGFVAGDLSELYASVLNSVNTADASQTECPCCAEPKQDCECDSCDLCEACGGCCKHCVCLCDSCQRLLGECECDEDD